MHRRHVQLLGFVVVVALSACGDGDRTTADSCGARAPASDDLRDRLAAAPCVAAVVEQTSQRPGYRVFDLRFTQLVDHDEPQSETFLQQATLMVRDEHAPMILVSTGYWNYYGQNLSELTALLRANQIVVEHRYFQSSIPASHDWTQLTIANAADDHHQIVRALKPIFGAAWLSTGGSKGGMTSVYHRRFWPDDVAGTVAYVAPLTLGAPDNRYVAFTDAIGTPECRKALHDVEVELLSNRRAMLEQRATDEAAANNLSYTNVPIAVAVESAVVSIYWTFWQYIGVGQCSTVPAVSASDDEMWSFLELVSPVSDSTDDNIALFAPYTYQADFQLGYPGTDDTWIDGLTRYNDFGYWMAPRDATPPMYDPGAMRDIDAWLEHQGARLLFVYGEWDPWSGGKFQLGRATGSALYQVPHGTHRSQLRDLPSADRAAASHMLAAWTGVTPVDSGSTATALVVRTPPAVAQAWRLQARAQLRSGLSSPRN